MRIQIELQNSETDLAASAEQLKMWMGVDTLFRLENEALVKVDYPFRADSMAADHPALGVASQEVQLAESELQLQQSSFLPDLQVGYINQQLGDRAGLQAFIVGMKVPLFFWGQSSKVSAARVGREALQYDFEDQYRRWENQRIQSESQLQKKWAELLTIEREGLPLAQELLDLAQTSYAEGSIDYLEYISNTSEALTIQREYLEAIYAYNIAVVDWYFNQGYYPQEP
jgi:cobalt-zinc-cadmium resistance protein CzcA